MKGLLRDRRGFALIWTLVFIPLLLSALILTVDNTRSTTASDIDVQRGLEQAVKAAAIMVTSDSQADGKPKIHTTRALNAFNNKLAANLGLDTDTLTPLPGSTMKGSPDYVLIVYNGDGSYAASGAETAWKYVFSNGVLTGGPIAASGFPYRFGVTENDVLPGGGGVLSVTLDMPGCVAVIYTRSINILGKKPLISNRYAAAKIVYRQ